MAAVSEVGKVTAVAVGTAIITFTTVDGGYTATCEVTVTPAIPEAVDLGLSVKWASFNLGATAPEGYGDYYAWGEIETKSNYSWETYKWCNGTAESLSFTKYNTRSDLGTVDNKTVLDPEDDVAHVALGGSWRMPTNAEWTELRENCTWTSTTQSEVIGYKVTGPNGNSIFLPAAGEMTDSNLGKAGTFGLYWSSTLITEYTLWDAWGVYFYSGSVSAYDYYRCGGHTIRPVTD